MKVVILAGGQGTRISEETEIRPKPMVEIGGKPILWHIMKIFSHHGFHDFVILLGYKGYVIKEYFANYFLHQSDVTIDLSNNSTSVHSSHSEPWRVTLLDTGLATQTGGRIARAQHHIGDERFLLTYGDGVGDIDVPALVAFHEQRGGTLTMTAVQPEGRFGSLDAGANGRIERFSEKPRGDGTWINAGFMVCEAVLFDLLSDGDGVVLERAPLEALAASGQLYAFAHTGFWKCMDTQRDRLQLEQLWSSGRAAWKTWG